MTQGHVNTGMNEVNDQMRLHTDPDCMHVTLDSMPVEDAPVKADDLELCSWCADTVDRPQDQTRECPYCGDTVTKLPDHLPCEETP
jgi:hypothetical protein